MHLASVTPSSDDVGAIQSAEARLQSAFGRTKQFFLQLSPRSQTAVLESGLRSRLAAAESHLGARQTSRTLDELMGQCGELMAQAEQASSSTISFTAADGATSSTATSGTASVAASQKPVERGATTTARARDGSRAGGDATDGARVSSAATADGTGAFDCAPFAKDELPAVASPRALPADSKQPAVGGVCARPPSASSPRRAAASPRASPRSSPRRLSGRRVSGSAAGATKTAGSATRGGSPGSPEALRALSAQAEEKLSPERKSALWRIQGRAGEAQEQLRSTMLEAWADGHQDDNWC